MKAYFTPDNTSSQLLAGSFVANQTTAPARAGPKFNWSFASIIIQSF